MTDAGDISDILGLLQWYRAMGCDAALDDAPTNWLARGAAAPGEGFQWPNRPARADPKTDLRADLAQAPATKPLLPQPSAETAATRQNTTGSPALLDARPRPATPLAASEAETEARRAARAAGTLSALEAALTAFDGCTLKATASRLCFYRGAETARLMLIGEAPGRDEDIEGKPFVGRAGQLLDRMLAAIKLTEADVHITNVVYWRPPGNRTPTPQEALACRPFLDRQIELVQPDFIVALGGAAAKEVLCLQDGIMRLRGKWRDVKIGERTFPVLATLHPAYLLRTPAAKQLAWIDLLSIQARLRG